MPKFLNNIDFLSIMYPDDKKTIDRLSRLKVPAYSFDQMRREVEEHPESVNFQERLTNWGKAIMMGFKYYTFKDFLRDTTSRYREAYNEVESQGEGIDITSESLPDMYRQLEKACKVLGIANIPSYTTDWYYGPYHYSNGEAHRRIIMMSGSVDLFTESEMMFVLGHELGHQACGHKPFHMLVETFYTPFADDVTLKIWASLIKMPLLEWYRLSDYTADRVGLLCCQDLNIALSTMIKKAGLPKKFYDQIDIESFKQQARDFEEGFKEIADKIVKILSVRSAEFPWLVDRAGKLIEWYESGEYQRIVNYN